MANNSQKETTIKRRKLIDADTGEELEATEILQTNEMKDEDFDKLWAGHFALITGVFGYAKMKVFSWLISNRDRRNNQIIATQQEIADGADVGTATVTRAIADLIEVDAISMKINGVYRLNPDLLFYGGPQKRMNVLYRYREEKAEKTGEDPYKKDGESPQMELAKG